MFLHVPWIKSKTCQRFTGELYLKKAPCDRVMQKIKHTRTFPSDFQTPNFIIKKKTLTLEQHFGFLNPIQELICGLWWWWFNKSLPRIRDAPTCNWSVKQRGHSLPEHSSKSKTLTKNILVPNSNGKRIFKNIKLGKYIKFVKNTSPSENRFSISFW